MDTQQIIREIAAGAGISMNEAASRFPRHRPAGPTAKHPADKINNSTIWRWMRSGIKLANGERVYLESARVGGRWLTTAAAIERFVAAQTPDIEHNTLPTPGSKSPRRPLAERARAAAKELEAAGIN